MKDFLNKIRKPVNIPLSQKVSYSVLIFFNDIVLFVLVPLSGCIGKQPPYTPGVRAKNPLSEVDFGNKKNNVAAYLVFKLFLSGILTNMSVFLSDRPIIFFLNFFFLILFFIQSPPRKKSLQWVIYIFLLAFRHV